MKNHNRILKEKEANIKAGADVYYLEDEKQ